MSKTVISSFDGEFRFLSNFYGLPIEYEGISFKSNEAAFQAMKTLDKDKRIEISQMPPNLAKRAGRTVKLREDWNDIRLQIMLDINRIKYSNEYLKKKLLATGDAELIEGNYWHDNFWGNCSCPKCVNIEGENNLGKILMQIREELKK